MDTTGGTRQMDMFMVQVVMACRHCDFLFVNFALINVIWFWFITKCDVSSINLQCHLSRFLLWNQAQLGLKNPHLFKVWSDWKSLRTTGCIYCIRLLLIGIVNQMGQRVKANFTSKKKFFLIVFSHHEATRCSSGVFVCRPGCSRLWTDTHTAAWWGVKQLTPPRSSVSARCLIGMNLRWMYWSWLRAAMTQLSFSFRGDCVHSSCPVQVTSTHRRRVWFGVEELLWMKWLVVFTPD